jgi:hypothetical protein
MTEPTHPCPGVTKPGTARPLLRCGNCERYAWGATGMQPAMRQRDDGSWHCENEVPVGVVAR